MVYNCSFLAPSPVFRVLWKSSISQRLVYWRAQVRAWTKSVTGWPQSSNYSRLGVAASEAPVSQTRTTLPSTGSMAHSLAVAGPVGPAPY